MPRQVITSAADLQRLVDDFATVAAIAGMGIHRHEIAAEFHSAPHQRPGSLPKFRQAVYGFMLGERCLKVGKAGPLSPPRYTSHHYNPRSSGSNLAKSLLGSAGRLKGEVPAPIHAAVESLSDADIGAWIERSTSRFNILIGAEFEEYELSFLESFVQCRLRPLYEGRARE